MKFLLSFLLGAAALLFATEGHGQQYVFYLHGQIVEGTATDPISESYGRYEYSKIVEALQRRGYVVLSERRRANTDPMGYAVQLTARIDSLKKNGVPSEKITVIGASKGAYIAMLTSGMVKDKQVKYVLMAGCSEGNSSATLNLYGQVLSIYEKSDAVGSCSSIRKRSQGISRYKEIALNTNLRHGFIYRPMAEWMEPATAWIGQ